MSELPVLDDCDGLKFQHGPLVEFSFDVTEEQNIHIQISNIHDIIFVSQNRTVYVYRLSYLLSSVVANECYDSHLLDRIDLDGIVERMHILTRLHLIAFQLSHKVIVYDFANCSTRVECDFSNRIECVQWRKEGLLVLDTESVLYTVSLNGYRRQVMTDCHNISPIGAGFHLACRYDGTLWLQIFKDRPDPTKFVSVELPKEYSDSNLTAVAGCHVISETLVAIGLILDAQDSLLLLCGFQNNTAKVLHWGFNELYLNVQDTPPKIEFLWIDEWQCLFAWSNVATMVVVISRHVKLVKNGKWHVVNMKEGYCLESVDIDSCPTDLVVCKSYRDKLYRKKACEDAPLLIDPPTFMLAQGTCQVALHYADVWVIDKNYMEVEKLPRLADGSEGILFSSLKMRRHGTRLSQSTKPNSQPKIGKITKKWQCDSSTSIKAVITQFETSRSLEPSTRSNDNTLIEEQQPSTSSPSADQSTTVSSTTHVVSQNDVPGRIKVQGPMAEDIPGIIEHIYRKTVHGYNELVVDKEVKLERIRLIEMLCNCFHIFESRLRDLESVVYCEDIVPPQLPLKQWIQRVEELKVIQKATMRELNSIKQHSPITRDTPLIHGEMQAFYEKALDFYTRPFKVHGFEADLCDMEAQLNGVRDNLQLINQKLDRYEMTLSNLETKRIIHPQNLVTSHREHHLTSNEVGRIELSGIDDLERELKGTHIRSPVNEVIGYKEVHMKYNEYAESFLKANQKDGETSNIPYISENKYSSLNSSTCVHASQSNKVDQEIRQLVVGPSDTIGNVSTHAFIESMNGMHIEARNNSVEDKTGTIETSHITNMLQETTRGGNFTTSGSSNSPNDTFGSSVAPPFKPCELNMHLADKVDVPNKEQSFATAGTSNDLFQRQRYAFGQDSATSQCTLSGGIQAQSPATSGSTTFASLVGGSSVSFADLATSKKSGHFFTNEHNNASINTTTSSGFTAMNGSTGFTGASAFTTGSFVSSDVNHGIPSFSNLLDASEKTNGRGNDVNTTSTTLASDMWRSCRRSNPLD